MKFFLTLAAVLFLSILVNAQSQNVTVQVGAGGQLQYNSSNFSATNGTNVTFIFPSGSIPHSVTQGSFDNPCVYLNDSNGAGFDSGLQTGKQFTIRVTNDQQPIWYFCKTTGHCGLGMVGAINPPSGDAFSAYLAAAKALGANAPAVTTDSGPITSGVGAVPAGTPTTTKSSSSSGSTPKSSSSSSSSSSAGHLVTDGVFAFLAAALGITLV